MGNNESPAASAAEFLTREFLRRRQKNNRYSLRAFAGQLKIPPGRLSEYFSSKRQITKKAALKIADRLDLDQKQRNLFFGLFNNQQKNKSKAIPVSRTRKTFDEFHLISDWLHLAILNLIDSKGFRYSFDWIGRRLNAHPSEVRSAVKRLLRLNLVSEMVKGEETLLCRTESALTTSMDVPSSAIRNFHKQILQKALSAVENVDVEKRDNSCMVFPINPRSIPSIKDEIQEFRRYLCEKYEVRQGEEVYSLSIQFFPLTTSKEKK